LPAQVVTSNGDIYEVACSALLVQLQLQPAALLHSKSRPVSLAELLMASQGLYVQLTTSVAQVTLFLLQAATSLGVGFSAPLVQTP
jgi:hypothetical protein